MIIMGIDPGTHRLGYGAVHVAGSKLTAITYGCIEPKKDVLAGDRLLEIFDSITRLVSDIKPDSVAIEELFFAKNVTTGLHVAEARGVVILAARQAQVPIAEYKPNAIKSAVAGYGLAQKPQMQKMVQMLLGLKELPKPDDAADGLAIAICHAVLGRQAQLGR
jgi:crossover junction endodeoxyribonuclease RuvC